MSRKRKKKSLGPRRKRMNRAARLQSAKTWLSQFCGKNVVRGYCKHYGVDWRSAAIELKQLGVQIDAAYLQQRETTDEQRALARKRRRETCLDEAPPEGWMQYDSPLEAYLAEDYVALHAMESLYE